MSFVPDWLHSGLDVAGFVPGFGAAADVVNAGLYGLEGDGWNAGLSLAAAIPGPGDAFKAMGMGGKALNLGLKGAHGAVGLGTDFRGQMGLQDILSNAGVNPGLSSMLASGISATPSALLGKGAKTLGSVTGAYGNAMRNDAIGQGLFGMLFGGDPYSPQAYRPQQQQVQMQAPVPDMPQQMLMPSADFYPAFDADAYIASLPQYTPYNRGGM